MYRGRGQVTFDNAPQVQQIKGGQTLFVGFLTGGFRAWLQSIEVIKNERIGKKYLGDNVWFYLAVVGHLLMSTFGIILALAMPLMYVISATTVAMLILRMNWLRKLVRLEPLPRVGYYHHGSPRQFWYKIQRLQPKPDENPVITRMRELKIQALLEPPVLIVGGLIATVVDPVGGMYLLGGGIICLFAGMTRWRDLRQEMEELEIDQLEIIEGEMMIAAAQEKIEESYYGNPKSEKSFIIGVDDEPRR